MQPIPPPPGQPGAPPPGYPYPYPYPPPPKKASLLWLWILLGVGGVVVVLGILAAIAIPSFMEYQKKAKHSEAELNLNALGKGAKAAYHENGEFPRGSSGPTPPLGACCSGPNHKCEAKQSDWVGSYDNPTVWDALDFEQTAPFLFSYSYEGSADGQSFTAKAHGDLDCDGTFIEYELRGSAIGGTPSVTIIKPTRSD